MEAGKLITAQVAEPSGKFAWNPHGIEIIILLGVILTMTLALVLWRRFYGRRGPAEE